MELVLVVQFNRDNSFEVYREMNSDRDYFNRTVLKLDMNYTPWLRKGGNLLW